MALGNEGDTFHQDNRPSGLIRTYLGRSPLVSGDESSLLLNAASTVARPVFTEYQASAFGNVKLVVHDCPVWVSGSGCAVRRPKEPVVWILPPLVSYFPDCLARGYFFYFILVNIFWQISSFVSVWRWWSSPVTKHVCRVESLRGV